VREHDEVGFGVAPPLLLWSVVIGAKVLANKFDATEMLRVAKVFG
jgi:hypothetical protein